MLTTEHADKRAEIEAEADLELSEVYGGEGFEQPRLRAKWYVAGAWPFRRISFECPGCIRWLSVNSSHSGRSGFCPSCDLTVCAPDIESDLPAAMVSTSKKMPATRARELPEQVFEARPANELRPDSRSDNSPELDRLDLDLDQESEWGIQDDDSLVPISVVTRFQAVRPWAGILAMLVAAVFVGRMFLNAPVSAAAKQSAATAIEKKPKPKHSQIGSNMWVVLDSLAMAGSAEEMATLVRNSEEMLPKMQAYYKRNTGSLPHHFERTAPKTMGYEIDGRQFARFEGRCDGRPVKFSFEKTQYGWRLDWESLIGYSEIPWDDFLETRPAGEHQFRVLAKVSTDGLLEYDREQYLCMQLHDHLGTGYGFALLDRHSAAAGRIRKFLQLYDQGKQPTTWVTPIIKCREDSDELLEIVDFKSGSWLVP